MDFSPLKKAGLHQQEVADLIGVCRATVSRWYNHHTRPHRLVRKRVETTLSLITQALADKQLPLDPLDKPKRRLEQLREITGFDPHY